MAFYTTEKRLRSDGTPRYRCTVGVKEKGKYTHRENRTFEKLAYAKAWGAKRVAEIEQGIAGIKAAQVKPVTLGELIDLYMKAPSVELGRTKREGLDLISRCDVANVDVITATSTDYVNFAMERRGNGAGPATIKLDISHISSVIKSAHPLFGINANRAAIIEAREYLSHYKIIAPSNMRNRRPISNEVNLIFDALKEKEKTAYSGAPFSQIFMFSILTCMRVGEVCALLWDDVDFKDKSVLVRDRKDPRKKKGNHMIVPLLGGAWNIIDEQPRGGELIFPYRSRNISQVYRGVRDSLGIEDLRYHDLRREGASRLFEMGFSVEEVAQVTGHKNLLTLWKVYREMFPQTLHDKFNALQRAREKDA